MEFEKDVIAPFKTAVNSVTWPTQRNLNQALYDELGKKYSYQPTGSWSLQDLQDSIRNKIRDFLNQGKGDPSSVLLKKIASHLNFRRFVHGESNEKYINAAHFLFDMTRQDCKIDDASKIDWVVIMDMLFDLSKLSNFYDVSSGKITLFESNRERAVGNSMQKLMKLGCAPEVVEGDLYLDEKDFKKINSLIESEINTFGGINLLKVLFNHWYSNGLFNKEQQRFNIIVQTDTMGKKTDPTLPVGYLVNLCLKYPNNGNSGEQTGERLKKIQDLATTLISGLDVEAFSSWETEFRSGNSAMTLMREVALLDSNFKLPQISPNYFLVIVEGLFSWVKNDGLDAGLPLEFDDIYQYCQHIDSIFKNQHIPKEYSYQQIIPPGFSDNKKLVLKEYLIHEVPPNSDFLGPTDWHKVDAVFKPFIKIDDNKVLGMNAGWNVLATFEAILTYFRNNLKNFDGQLGYSIESLVKAEASKKGLTVFSGEYTAFDNNDAEVDVAPSLDKLIPLMEIKKKPLTRKARSGSDEALLIDVAKSLLDSQIQTLRHELTLRKNGKIDFNNGSSLTWDTQEIERISVCLFDYGGLQDRTIIQQLLRLYYRSKFSHHDPKINQKFQELNLKTMKFGDLYDEWVKEIGGHPNMPFFSCWFLSVPQIFLLLDNVKSDDEFKENLWHTRHMTMKTLDFYYEYSYMKKIKTQ